MFSFIWNLIYEDLLHLTLQTKLNQTFNFLLLKKKKKEKRKNSEHLKRFKKKNSIFSLTLTPD